MRKFIVSALMLSIVLSAPAALAGDTELYGDMRYTFNSVKDSTGIDGTTATDNTSLFGVKGKYGDGDVKAFFHIQTGAQADKETNNVAMTQRFYMAGLDTAVGTFRYGRMTNAYKMPGFAMDRFYNSAGINVAGVFAAGGGSYGLSGATNGFTDNSLEYDSPKIADMVVLSVGTYIDDSNDNKHGYSYGAKFTSGPIMVGVVGAQNGATATVPGIEADGSAIRGYGSFKGDGWSLGASYENLKAGTSAGVDKNYLYVIGSYNVSKELEGIASFGSVDKGSAEGTGGRVGLFYGVAKNTKLFAQYSFASLKDDVTHATTTSPTVLAIGAFHHFSLSN